MFQWLFGRKFPQRAQAQQVSQTSQPLRLEHQGRRHRDDVPYALPKDLEEGQRLNLQHYVFRYILRGNYSAPLPENLSSILDVGCGTGIWGQEMAHQFPSARVYGLDLEPPQSVSLAAAATISNYQFIQGNVLEGLPFPDKMFDYTHQRMLVAAIPRERWLFVIREMARITRPYGWIELLEISSEIWPAGPATTQIQAWLNTLFSLRGIDMSFTSQLGDMLTQCNLHSVSCQPLDIPLGSWDRHLGVMMEKDLLSVFKALKPAVCAREGVAPQAFDQYLEEAADEWKHQRTFCRFYLAYGQV